MMTMALYNIGCVVAQRTWFRQSAAISRTCQRSEIVSHEKVMLGGVGTACICPAGPPIATPVPTADTGN